MSDKTKEVEVKYKLEQGQKEPFVEKIKKIDGELQKKVKEIDTYYSRPDVDFMETKECLRIRETSNYAELTYKPGSTNEMKENDKFWKKEVDIDVTNQTKQVEELLEDLEFPELATVEKKREIYKVYDVLIAVDKVINLGYFVELEVQSKDKAYALETIESYEIKLDLEDKNEVSQPYRDLIIDNK